MNIYHKYTERTKKSQRKLRSFSPSSNTGESTIGGYTEDITQVVCPTYHVTKSKYAWFVYIFGDTFVFQQRCSDKRPLLVTDFLNGIYMKIGMIGAGEIGGTLTRQYTSAGHDVKMANARGPETLKSLGLETGASPVTLEEVVTDVDLVVISIPLIGILKLPRLLFKNTPPNTTIIDTCNYYPIRDGKIAEIENGMPESVWVSTKIQRPVIKAYNSIFFQSLVQSGVPKGHASRLALPVAGDRKQSKDLVSMLIDISGFDSLDYGSLEDSWKQQPGSPVYCTDLTLAQLKNSISKARRDVLPERRELGLQYILKHDRQLWRDNVIYNRKIYESDLTG